MPPVLHADQDAASGFAGRRRNPWVIALWVIAGVLLVIAVSGGVFAAKILFEVQGFSGSASAQSQREWAQLAYVMFPGFFTAGIIAAVLAVALQAHEAYVRARPIPMLVSNTAPVVNTTSVAPSGTPVIAPLTVPQPTRAQPAKPDYSQFMRPPADAG